MQEIGREKCIFLTSFAPYLNMFSAKIGEFLRFARPIWEVSQRKTTKK